MSLTHLIPGRVRIYITLGDDRDILVRKCSFVFRVKPLTLSSRRHLRTILRARRTPPNFFLFDSNIWIADRKSARFLALFKPR